MAKKSIFLKITLIVVILLIILAIILMAISTTPKSIGQKIVLGSIRDCIWYGFDEKGILGETGGEKNAIILPKSLMEYTPIVIHYNLNKLEGFTDDCDLIYNPNGYEQKTWVVIYNANDIESRLWGNYVLWSNKEIKRKRGIIGEIKKEQGLKYYSTSTSE